MEKYSLYKRSRFEWLGEIPEHWVITKNRYGFKKNNNGINNNDLTPVLSLTTRGVKVKKNLNFGKSSESYIGHQLVKEGDIVFTPRDFDQTPILSDVSKYNGCISNLYIVDKTKDHVLSYYVNYFWYGLKYSVNYFKNFSHGMRFSFNRFQFDEIPLLIPPLNEQNKIVEFLDSKTELIDRLISIKEKKINLLKEQRTSFINQVITKGLNPNVKMKDSGVEWIGEIPEHWLLGKIKFLSEVISKGTTPSTVGRDVLEEGNIFYVKVENIKDGYVGVPPSYFIDEETDIILRRSSLKEDDILVVITGSTIGKVVILPKQFIPSNTNQGISFIRLKNKSNVRFVWYWLCTELIQDRIKVVCTKSTQPNLSMEDLGNFSIPIPNNLEQSQIVEFLDSKTIEIDDLVQLEQKKIDLLKEYRQSLISEVVTGKIKVTL